jgi:4-carboxymuconolactone decarboxylase
MLTPEVKGAMGGLAGALYKTAIPQDLLELTVLVVARHWGTQFEWWVHAPQAVIEGVPAEIVDAIRLGKRPSFTSPGQEAVYHYLVELMRDQKVSDATYEKLRAIVGPRQVVEITVLAGNYKIDAMSFAAHNLPFRADVKPPLPKLANAFPK